MSNSTKICDGYNQHNSCNGGIMYNIANILPTFCKVYLRLFLEINSKNIGY